MTSISIAQGDAWTTKAKMLTERSGHSSCVVNGKIYVIGGVKDTNSLTISTVEVYDPATDIWITKSGNMQTPRSYTAACAVNGKIYVIGGVLKVLGDGLSIVDEYDPAADTWTRKTDMPTARVAHSASVVNGKIYAIGGKPKHGVTPLTTVEEYDPATDTWTSKTGMNKERFGLATCVVNGKIYAIGGSSAINAPFNTLSTVEEYEPVTDTWITKAKMLAARGYFSASAVNGKIYAIGGGRNLDTSLLSTVEEYDPVADKWTKKTDMPTARFFLSTSAINDKIYAIGGWVTTWSSSESWQACSTMEEYDPSFDQPTSVGNPSRGHNPINFILHQNYPNPFNPATMIHYQVPITTGVELTIYNLLGQKVATLVSEKQAAGRYKVKWDASGQTSGVYLYCLKSGSFIQTRKMLFLQ